MIVEEFAAVDYPPKVVWGDAEHSSGVRRPHAGPMNPLINVVAG